MWTRGIVAHIGIPWTRLYSPIVLLHSVARSSFAMQPFLSSLALNFCSMCFSKFVEQTIAGSAWGHDFTDWLDH